MRTAALLLAAGGSERLGRPKQLLKIDGETLLHRSARLLLNSSARPVMAVLGANADACARQLGDLPIQTVFNPRWRDGLASSIRAGIAAVRLQPEVSAVVIVLCDQPFLSTELIEELIAKRAETGQTIVASAYGGVAGVPAVFGEQCFDDLAALDGDSGARKIFPKYRGAMAAIPFPGGELDIDTIKDWSKLPEIPP